MDDARSSEFEEGASFLPRIAAGDERAVQGCMDQYQNLVWSIVRRMGPSIDDAEDGVQEVFLDLWKNAHRFDPERSSEVAFVAMVARRRMIDRMRASGRRPQTIPIPDDLDFATEQHHEVDRRLDASYAMQAIGRLRPEQREVLLMSVVEGIPHGEISARIQVPLGTVKSLIRRGLAEVRESLVRPPGPV